jgi:ABC-type nickel/cobalt efflux system permease component RcnA
MSPLRIIAIILGIVIAAIGGVIAYRAWFLEPSSAVIITETHIRRIPDTLRVVSGLLILAVGAMVAFLAARRRPA